MEKGEITCTGMQSVRLSTSFGINNKQIAIGSVMDGKTNDVDEDCVSGFVDCFSGREDAADVDELQKHCSCRVKTRPDGRIEYEVKCLDNQTLTPAIALQLFIKYLVLHERARSNISFSRVTVAYPVYFTQIAVQYLEYLLQSCLMIPLRCVSQLSCYVSGFGPYPTTPGVENHTLVLFADYSLFHVFACSYTSSRVVIRSHLETSRISHSKLVHAIVSEILRSLDGIDSSNMVKESMDTLFTACYQMLIKYAVQSIATLELSVNNTRYKRTFTDNAVFQILSPLFSSLTADISLLCRKLQWEPSSLSRIILTGEASSLFVFRRWLQQDFPSVDWCCCYDVLELLRSTPDLDMVTEWSGEEEMEKTPDATLPTNLFDVLHQRRRRSASFSEAPLEVTETAVETPLSFKVSLDARDTEMIYCGEKARPKKLPEEVAVETAKLRDEVTLKGAKLGVLTRRGKAKLDQEEKEKEAKKEGEKKRKRRRQSVNWDALTIISGPRKASVTALETMRKQLTRTRKKHEKKEKEEKEEKKRKREEEKMEKEERKRKRKEKKEKKEKEKKEKKEKKEEVSYSPIPVPPFHIDSFHQLPTEHLFHEWTLLPKHTIVQPATLGSPQSLWDTSLLSPLYTAEALQEAIPSQLNDGIRLHRYSNGATYSGGVVDHERSGSGKLTYTDGSWYQGEFLHNARQGSGMIRKKNKCFFKGVFEGDAPKKGLLTYSDGARYDGSFEAGLPHGKGIFYGNGQEALWDGEWSRGRMDGLGTYFFENGDYYDGRMKEGRPDGEGMVCNKKGSVLLKGKWKEGMRDGEFTVFFTDGSYCCLTYEKDVKNGPCSFYNAHTTLIGSGNFEKGVFSGKGRFLFEDGSVYEGAVKDGEFDGEGTYTFPSSWVITAVYKRNQKDGNVEIVKNKAIRFVGTCRRGRVDGPGTEYVNGEVVYKGNYTDGIPHGKGTIYFENGMYYQGTVKKGVISGLGVICDKNGAEVHKGSFRQNQFVAPK